jgi:membrane protease YdiL (CAAX protease family)
MVRRLFIGSAGLRTGWAILTFIFWLTLFGYLAILALPNLENSPDVVSPTFAFYREGVLLAVILLATAIMALIENRSVWSYGLQGPGKHLLYGSAWGFLFLSLLIALMTATHHLVFDKRLLYDGQALRYGFVWACIFLLVAVGEEALFRGYILATLARTIGFWPAAIFLAIGFAAAHLRNHLEDFLGLAVVMLGGLVFSLCLRLSGSLLWGIGFHAAWDWGQSFVYGTRDSGYMIQEHLLSARPVGDARFSGGSVGPEGSASVLLVFCLALAILPMVLRRRASPLLIR